MSVLPEFVASLGDGLYCIDTGFHRPNFDAAYLLVDSGRAAFIDTGTNFAVPHLLAALDALGLGRDAVDWVIPTHVHLDHAGGAGALMRELPHARLLVHPRRLRHMLDPSALYRSALTVYGEQAMARDYGTLVATVQRLLERRPRCMYLTHFGRVGDVERLGAALLEMLQRMAAIGRENQRAGQRPQRLREARLALYLAGLRAHGCTSDDAEAEALLSMDLDLNAKGMDIWLDRRTARPS